MVYDTSRTLAQQSYQHWISSEVFSFGWFLTIFVLAVFYIVWIKLVDKSRLGQLLLLGALAGVGFIVVSGMVLNGLYGVAEYKIRPFPLIPAIFIVSVTKAPIIIMLVHQYTSTWKGYMLWTGIGMAFLAFVLYPIYSLVGIYQMHNWNYFYQFLLLLIGAILSRLAFLWIMGIQQRNSAAASKQAI